MIEPQRYREALEWQIGVGSRMSNVYVEQIDLRLAPVVEGVIQRARLIPGERVLDLGTGTGAVAARAVRRVRGHEKGEGSSLVFSDFCRHQRLRKTFSQGWPPGRSGLVLMHFARTAFRVRDQLF